MTYAGIPKSNPRRPARRVAPLALGGSHRVSESTTRSSATTPSRRTSTLPTSLATDARSARLAEPGASQARRRRPTCAQLARTCPPRRLMLGRVARRCSGRMRPEAERVPGSSSGAPPSGCRASGIAPALLLEEGISSARRNGDRRSELRGTIELQWQRFVHGAEAGRRRRIARWRSEVIPGPRGSRRSAGARKGVVAAQRVTRNRSVAGAHELDALGSGRSCTHAAQATRARERVPSPCSMRSALQLRGRRPCSEGDPRAAPSCSRRYPAAPTFEAGLRTTARRASPTRWKAAFGEARRLYARTRLPSTRSSGSVFGEPSGRSSAPRSRLWPATSTRPSVSCARVCDARGDGRARRAIDRRRVPGRGPVPPARRRRGGALRRDRARDGGAGGRRATGAVACRAASRTSARLGDHGQAAASGRRGRRAGESRPTPRPRARGPCWCSPRFSATSAEPGEAYEEARSLYARGRGT